MARAYGELARREAPSPVEGAQTKRAKPVHLRLDIVVF